MKCSTLGCLNTAEVGIAYPNGHQELLCWSCYISRWGHSEGVVSCSSCSLWSRLACSAGWCYKYCEATHESDDCSRVRARPHNVGHWRYLRSKLPEDQAAPAVAPRRKGRRPRRRWVTCPKCGRPGSLDLRRYKVRHGVCDGGKATCHIGKEAVKKLLEGVR